MGGRHSLHKESLGNIIKTADFQEGSFYLGNNSELCENSENERSKTLKFAYWSYWYLQIYLFMDFYR